jgi:hypothetical protein
LSSFTIKGDLSEKQIEADVAMYLGWCSAGLPFRLLDVDEQETGADKRCDIVVPIYIQFKKSTGLKAAPPEGIRRRVNEGKLQGIRRFRQNKQLADDPTYFFQLRAKAETATDLQHNILLSHHRPQSSFAVYVAPLYLDRANYYDELTKGPRHLDSPWDWRRSDLHRVWDSFTWLSRFDLQPFLRNHISIAPHERVTDHNHYYAYSTAGDEVSWHSPSVIDVGPSRLSDFMSRRVKDIMLGTTDATLSDALEVAHNVLNDLGVPAEYVMRDAESSFDRLRNYGHWLSKEHSIHQFLLCTTQRQRAEVSRIIDELPPY